MDFGRGQTWWSKVNLEEQNAGDKWLGLHGRLASPDRMEQVPMF